MFSGRHQAIPQLGEMTKPSVGRLALSSLESPILKSTLPLNLDPNARSHVHAATEQVENDLNDPEIGIGQNVLNKTAGFVGSVLSPVNLIAGEGLGVVAGKVASGAGGLIGRHVPLAPALVATAIAQKPLFSLLGKTVPKFVGEKTVGQMAAGAGKGFAIGTGFSLPEEIANTYDEKSDSFNYWGGIKASMADGGVGLGLMAAPYLAGTLWGKAFGKIGEEINHAEIPLPGDIKAPEEGAEISHPTLKNIQKAQEDGKISDHEAKFLHDYVTKNVSNDDLANRAAELLIKDGHPVNAATKEVMFKLLQPEHVEQLQTAIADQLASQAPEEMKEYLSHFMVRNAVDDLRGNSSKMWDGLSGVVSFIRKRLEKKPEEMVNVNKILRKQLPDVLKDENPFTQHKIYQALKAGKKTDLTVPDHVRKRIKNEEKVKSLKEANKNYEREFNKSGKPKFKKYIDKNNKKISEIESSPIELLSHPDEIEHLRSKLFKDGKPVDNFKVKDAYHRLLDLTRVRNDARRLMNELHIAHEFEKQENLATILDTMTKTMRSSVARLANPEHLIDYMKSRIKDKAPEIKEFKQEERLTEKVKEEKEKQNPIKVLSEEMEKTESKGIKEEFEALKNKYNEFHEESTVFKNLIACVAGGLGGNF